MDNVDSQAGQPVHDSRGSRGLRVNARAFWQAATTRDKLVMILGIIYVVSPVDLLPEAILGPFGLLDDGGAAVAIVSTALAVLGRHKAVRAEMTDGS